MAQKKTSAKTPTAKKTANSTAKRKAPTQKGREPEQLPVKERNPVWAQTAPFVLIVAALLITICLFTGGGSDPGIVMGFLYRVLTGLFSVAAFFVPVFLAYVAVMGFLDRERGIMWFRAVFAGVSAILISVLMELIKPQNSFSVPGLYKNGTALHGGGVFGGLIGEAFLVCFKSAGSYVIVIAALILSVLLMAGLTPKYLFLLISKKLRASREERAEERARRAEEEAEYEEYDDPDDGFVRPDEELSYDEDEYEIDEETGEVTEKADIPPVSRWRRKKFDTDVPIDAEMTPDGEDEDPDLIEETPDEKRARINDATYKEVMRRSRQIKSKSELAAEKALFDDADGETFDSENITEYDIPDEIVEEELAEETELHADDPMAILDNFANQYEEKNSATLSVSKTPISKVEKPAEPAQVKIEIPKPEYKFPPIEYLTADPGNKADNIRAELHENASKLVNVLASFNVRTKIVGVSRGPSITRYELLPEAGTRVRSISNLVDDIALNLATSGVRIEAPIPGKAAVGIEVPNKQAETVYLRTLIESEIFENSKSKLTTSLGEDVAGAPVIMDVAKMPHLLVAGATGMGKSVCINCLLVSFLYKASPEELKLILIDPKKVEFSLYNGLPHLLVPVVSDAKKAAGSLNWAVNEMERRYGLIEAVGVRDIRSYNEKIATSPEYEKYEYLPQIVIVIDELADLMTVAANDVETSIARLAAKARAAGMHLIIATQRPSVDVVTGVIKANIPSRIALTVASQVDSRTIIDRSGAENLIGKGDMLYAPVGAAKPIRVQGAFVSDGEIERIVKFIKDQSMAGDTTYSDEIMKEIEEQAALCGAKKGSGSSSASDGDAGEGDPLIEQAMEVAFESGKISTSLLQRRLSVGYGRAAKIIDYMENKGFVSAPEGQKPREVLITKDQFMELQVREEEI